MRATINSGDEVEILAGAFNHMLEANEDALTKLEATTERALAADRLKSATVDRHVRSWEKPSDHVPVRIDLA